MSDGFDDLPKAVVIDNGSGSIKAGIAGEDNPGAIFPSIVGRPNHEGCKHDTYVGERAQIERDLLSIRHPIEHGIVRDWDDVDKLWEHAYRALRTSPAEYPALVIDALMTPKGQREKMMEIFFEKHGVPAFHVVTQAILAFYASGSSHAINTVIGDGVIDIVPVYYGNVITPAMRSVHFAGRDLTNGLMTSLQERDYSFATSAERDIVREIKEQHCYVAFDYDQELITARAAIAGHHQHRLADGQTIDLGSECFGVPELLFQPSLAGHNHRGIHELIFDSLMNCDVDLRSNLMVNFVIAGGTSMMTGFRQRLEKELASLAARSDMLNKRVRVWTPTDPWIGGSILASLEISRDMYIQKGEYEEHGPKVVHEKCKN